jgi:hypothetical protein
MTNQSAKNLISEYLSAKLAAGENPMLDEAMHEQMESPAQEAEEHMPGGYEEGEMEPMEGMGDMGGSEGDAVEHALSQLSPEQVEQLASELSQDMQTPGSEDSGEIGDLASAIEQHLAQNPEASAPGIAPEKAAALSFVKSASYIEGFLNEAIEGGANIKQAVDLYDSALTQTVQSLKTAEIESKESVKIASYYDGVFERALDYGYTVKEAEAIVYAAMSKESGIKDIAKGVKKTVRKGLEGIRKHVEKKTYENFDKRINKYPAARKQVEIRKNEAKAKGRVEGGVGGALAAGGVAALASGKKEEKEKKSSLKGDQHKLDVDNDGKIEATDLKKLRQQKDKTAAYCEGIFKRALEYGFSEQEALALVDSAIEKSAFFRGKSNLEKIVDSAKKTYKSEPVQKGIGKAREFVDKNKSELAAGGAGYFLGKSRGKAESDEDTKDKLLERLEDKK